MTPVIIMALTTYFLWRMVALNDIFNKPRDAVLDRAPDWVETMVMCVWCLGAWLALMVTWAYSNLADIGHVSSPGGVEPFLLWPAVSTLTGVIHMVVDWLEWNKTRDVLGAAYERKFVDGGDS